MKNDSGYMKLRNKLRKPNEARFEALVVKSELARSYVRSIAPKLAGEIMERKGGSPKTGRVKPKK